MGDFVSTPVAQSRRTAEIDLFQYPGAAFLLYSNMTKGQHNLS
jgi:hypothetical protein